MSTGADNVRYAGAAELAVIPAGPVQMTPGEAAARAAWVREMKRSVLVAGVDYGQLPNTAKPVLWKSGAEILLLAAGFGTSMERVDDDDAKDHQGVTYRCTVSAGEVLRAACDGYAGYDESGFNYAKGRANWNTIIKMAQKRAYVGAALNACAASGLFVADLDDTAPADPAKGDLPVSGDERGFLRNAYDKLSDGGRAWFDQALASDPMKIPSIRTGEFHRDHRDRYAWHLVIAQRIKAAAATVEPDPEAA